MKLRLLIALFLVLTYTNSYAIAVEPSINNNVHVLRGVTPSQCPSSWRGNPGTADIQADTGEGMSNSAVGSGVTSCTGCAFDQASGDCVCATCYNNYN
jgi:hypothetical protein